jgi:PucR C-terminal helix-turn-helix domain
VSAAQSYKLPLDQLPRGHGRPIAGVLTCRPPVPQPSVSWRTGRTALAIERLLDAVLDGKADPHVADLAARAWSLPEKGRYAVVVRQAVSCVAPVERPKLPLMVNGIRVLWRSRPDCQIGIVVLGDTEVPAFAEALPVTPGWRAGVSLPVNGLAGLFRGRQLAELAARTITAAHGVACVQHRMTAALLTSRPDLAGELSGHVLAPLLELDQAYREVLLDTFTAWLAANGSMRRAAQPLYCHRNTVLNRLRRLEQLTSRSLSTPKDLVELTLAVEALRLSPNPPEGPPRRSRRRGRLPRSKPASTASRVAS